jgi:hypothetical protein
MRISDLHIDEGEEMVELQVFGLIFGFIVNLCLILRLRYSLPAILLTLIPFVNFFALGVFAFRRSPIEEELGECRRKVEELETALLHQRAPAPPSAPLTPES